jgi:hypothetical protein
LNKGYDWIAGEVIIYDLPTITSIQQLSFDSRGNFTIIINGNGFINATPYMFCVFIDNGNEQLRSKMNYIDSNTIFCKSPASYTSGFNLFISYGDSSFDTGYMVKYNNIPDVKELSPITLNIPNDVDIITDTGGQFGYCLSFNKKYPVSNVNNQQVCHITTLNNDYSTVEMSYNDIDYSINGLLEYKIAIIINSISPLLVRLS